MKLRVFGAAAALCLIGAAPGTVGKFKAVSFAETAPLASNGELIKRLFSPFASADLAAKNDAAKLNDFPIDVRDEKFGLYVPTQKPPRGYGLLVWVSPLNGAGMPLGWQPTLEARGVIFVTAERSGNFTSPLGRRVPLALTAAANVVRSYPVDRDRIWIAGFSGGARVAQRIAFAYPDVFSGVILDGSSDAIGSLDLPLPPHMNFERLVDRMAVVLTAGMEDQFNAASARRVAAGMRRHCMARLSLEVRRREGHVAMSGRSLADAIDFFDRADDGPSLDLRRCREELYSKIAGELARAEAMVQHGDRRSLAALRSIDRRYGGLAAPRSLELRARVGAIR